MSFFSNLIKKYKRATPKQLMLTGVFMLALAGAIGAGFASKGQSSAAVYYGRDGWRDNSIMKSGLIGCLSKEECIGDMQANYEGDLQGIYNHFGLSPSEYGRFLSEAKEGIVYKSGNVVVDGQTVMTNTWSIGRKPKSYSWPYAIPGVGTYHASWSTQVQGSDLPVYVLFDDDGTVETVIMKACGNSVGGDKVRSGGECKMLNKEAVDGKKNTYRFTSEASTFGLAKIVKYDYYYDEGNGEKHFATTTSGAQAVERTFDKSATVVVKVTLSLPGGKTKVVTSENCKKKIGVVKEEFLYVCDALIGTARDNANRKFRFTVITKQSNNVSVDSADFTLDGTVTTKNVTTTDDDGNFYKEYTFNDTKTHTVSAIVNFTADGKKVTSKEGDCVAEVTPEVCEYNPELPPDHPKCKPPVEECVPQGKEDENCELPSTGPAGVAGMFAGVTAAGTVAHRLWVNRRNRS